VKPPKDLREAERFEAALTKAMREEQEK